MKKQFFRVKQLADQTFLRADKSEGLNQDELKKADLKVEYIQKALTEIGKKLPSIPTTSSTNQESIEKRLKKYEEYGIAQSMLLQGENDISKEMLLQFVLKECGNAERALASVKMEHESEISEHVSTPINGILEKDLPNVIKQKKNLNKHILDKDSAKNRYQNAKKVGTIKENNLKEDMDEADIKLDQSRDCLATEMFGLLRREKEICSYFLQFLKMQRSYHEHAYKHLQEIIPKLEKTIGEDRNRPIFGCPLSEYLETDNLKIAFPLELCAFSLMELGGMSEEGLFRVTGSASRVKRLRLSIDSGCFTLPLIPEYRDVHVLASTLKLYLRELPEPLLTYRLYNDWMECMDYSEERRLVVIQDTLKKLPEANRDNLAFLMQFFSRLTKHAENRMTASNIAIVISPNLLWADTKEEQINMKNCATLNMIVELFINQIDQFFPVDMLKLIKLKSADLTEVEDFVRPDINCLRHSVLDADNADSASASPKPNLRFKKAKPAPAPPIQAHKPEQPETDNYYYSSGGTASLNRPPKLRPDRPVKEPKEDLRRRSLVDDAAKTKPVRNSSHSDLVNAAVQHSESDDDRAVESVTSVPTVEPGANKNDECAADREGNNQPSSQTTKPVAAPRTTINLSCNSEKAQKEESPMSKSLNCIDAESDANGATAILRRRESDEKTTTYNKPAIPIRPASLRNPRSTDSEATIVRSFNIPHKSQPCLVSVAHTMRNNANHNFAAGHDNQIAEKEKFLGHAPSHGVENKSGDINSNNSKPEVPTKPPAMKSTERLDLDSTSNNEPQTIQERFNGNGNASNKSSHVRTRSDGNIVDVRQHHEGASLLQAPPSPRSLNKPSQPPPPPPTVNKPKPVAVAVDSGTTTNL